jgi:hypothetical protein
LVAAFDPNTGALPPGNHQATLEQIAKRLGFTPRRRWLLKGLRTAVEAFWEAGIEEIYIDGSFCTRSRIQVMSTAIGLSPTKESMIASNRIGSTSNWSWFRIRVRGSGECGPIMALSFSFIRRCKPARNLVFRSSFGRTAVDDRAA